ncbi:hypothetical protein ASL83_003220 [Vibrio parahaemolyticus]|nr:hypothetical protein [Vibrio parahaemolyticus]
MARKITSNSISLVRDLGDGNLTTYTKAFPVYPSSHVEVPQSDFETAFEYLNQCYENQAIFTDGFTFIIPEDRTEIIDSVINNFNGTVTARDQQKKFEYATLAIDAGVEPSLINLGDGIATKDSNAKEMVRMALNSPEQTRALWHDRYLALLSSQYF